ncbi:MAG: hypothetical protein ACRDVZ_12170 [Jiangellaceae bacterium]
MRKVDGAGLSVEFDATSANLTRSIKDESLELVSAAQETDVPQRREALSEIITKAVQAGVDVGRSTPARAVEPRVEWAEDGSPRVELEAIDPRADQVRRLEDEIRRLRLVPDSPVGGIGRNSEAKREELISELEFLLWSLDPHSPYAKM